MRINNYKLILLFLSIASIIALSGAYIAQYIFNYQPCILCLYQRQPFIAIIVITAISFLFCNKAKYFKIASYFAVILIITNIAIASYHVGVEQKIFQGPTSCSSDDNLNKINDLEQLKQAFLKTSAVKCDEPQLLILGLSMAALNIIFCIILLGLSLYLYKKKT